jgi:hypothetical protein
VKTSHPLAAKGYLTCALFILGLIILCEGTSTAAIDMEPYYAPTLEPSRQKTYVEGGKYSITTVLPGTVEVNDIQTTVVETTGGQAPGSRDYYSKDATGFYFHRRFVPNIVMEGVGLVNYTGTYSPPFLSYPPILNIGQTISGQSGLVEEYVSETQGTGTYIFTYEYSYTAVAFEKVSVPLGNFDALKIEVTSRRYGTNYGQYSSTTITETFWTVTNLGTVKNVRIYPGGETKSRELAAINFNLPVLGDLDGDFAMGIADAIIGLKVLSNLNPPDIRSDYINSGADINGNNKVDLDEVMFILQKMSELR